MLRILLAPVKTTTTNWYTVATQPNFTKALGSCLTGAKRTVKALLAKPELILPSMLCIVDYDELDFPSSFVRCNRITRSTAGHLVLR